MRIGYACLAIGVPGSDMKRCVMRSADKERLASLTMYNLKALERMVDYNLENDIQLFRISSDLIPFGSSPVNQLDWADLYREDFARIGKKIQSGGMRVSMHPGQYTVLSTPDDGVAIRSIDELKYHARVLDALGTGADSKIILHLGGAYGDKNAAISRFEARINALDSAVRRRIALENDERLYSIGETLSTGLHLHTPVVFDCLHHAINPSIPASPRYWINACRETWKASDGPQKIHYSQQGAGKRPGSHSATVEVTGFLDYLHGTEREDLDIMLEVKDKNLSAIKCLLCTRSPVASGALEREWARYKYAVLEHSQAAYQEISALFHKGQPGPLPFYQAVERALALPVEAGSAVYAAQHVWGYFKSQATNTERRSFETVLARFLEGRGTLDAVKRRLHALSGYYGKRSLLESYYFELR